MLTQYRVCGLESFDFFFVCLVFFPLICSLYSSSPKSQVLLDAKRAGLHRAASTPPPAAATFPARDSARAPRGTRCLHGQLAPPSKPREEKESQTNSPGKKIGYSGRAPNTA